MSGLSYWLTEVNYLHNGNVYKYLATTFSLISLLGFPIVPRVAQRFWIYPGATEYNQIILFIFVYCQTTNTNRMSVNNFKSIAVEFSGLLSSRYQDHAVNSYVKGVFKLWLAKNYVFCTWGKITLFRNVRTQITVLPTEDNFATQFLTKFFISCKSKTKHFWLVYINIFHNFCQKNIINFCLLFPPPTHTYVTYKPCSALKLWVNIWLLSSKKNTVVHIYESFKL